MRVLIAIDGSKGSEIVLQEALARPWPPGTHFCLVTVVDPFFFTHAPALFEETKEAADDFLNEAAKKFEAAGWRTDESVVLGNPRRAISKYADDWRANLVLVGSHGLNALERLALGSTVRAVLRHAKCSVEVVRAPKKEAAPGGRRILIATDGSEFSNAAVKAVASEPWPKNTEIKVISIPEFALWLGEYPYFQRVRVEELNQSALDAAKAAVAKAKEILLRARLTVTTDVPIDRDAPAKTILEKAKEWGADLIVVGSHGRRGFDRWALGSVSESLAMNAPCSVEVVRAPIRTEIQEHEGESHESERSHDVHAVHVP
ncbi:MAG TPA: universal stress protein [Candidatus Acidoferrum sp.]